MESSDQEPTVTIVVATRNRPGDAVVAAGSVLAGDGIDFELVVVDQSDDDATEVALADLADDHRVRYVRVDRPGKTKAMNLGLRMARTPFVLFTDDDCEVPSDWAVEMVAALTEGEQVGAVFCGVVAGPHDENAGFVPTFDVPRDKTWTSTWRLATPEMGAGMAVRLAAVEEIGGFDEQMGPGGRFPSADDTDIATRLLAAGWHVVDTARTEVVHHGFRTFEQGRELTRRDWIALGAAYGKATRCRVWGAGFNGAYLGLSLGLVEPLATALKTRSRPHGLGRIQHFLQGFGTAFFSPVDRRSVLFE